MSNCLVSGEIFIGVLLGIIMDNTPPAKRTHSEASPDVGGSLSDRLLSPYSPVQPGSSSSALGGGTAGQTHGDGGENPKVDPPSEIAILRLQMKEMQNQQIQTQANFTASMNLLTEALDRIVDQRSVPVPEVEMSPVVQDIAPVVLPLAEASPPSLEKIKSSCTTEVIEAIDISFKAFKELSTSSTAATKKVDKLVADIALIDAKKVPNGYARIRQPTGHALFDQAAGSEQIFSITLSPSDTFREWKEKLQFHTMKCNAEVDRLLSKKIVDTAKPKLAYDTWIGTCKKHANDFTAKFANLNGPANLVTCKPEDAEAYGQHLYKNLAMQKAKDEENIEKEKEKKKKAEEKKRDHVAKLSLEQLKAAAQWQKNKCSRDVGKEVTYDSTINYVAIQESGAVPPLDNFQSVLLDEKDKGRKVRTFTKKQLAARKNRAQQQDPRQPKNGKSPVGVQGHNQKSPNSATQPKQKGQGKGKDNNARKATSKTKGKGKGKGSQKEIGKGAGRGKGKKK